MTPPLTFPFLAVVFSKFENMLLAACCNCVVFFAGSSRVSGISAALSSHVCSVSDKDIAQYIAWNKQFGSFKARPRRHFVLFVDALLTTLLQIDA